MADKSKRSADRVKEDFAPIIKSNIKEDAMTGKVLNMPMTRAFASSSA